MTATLVDLLDKQSEAADDVTRAKIVLRDQLMRSRDEINRSLSALNVSIAADLALRAATQ